MSVHESKPAAEHGAAYRPPQPAVNMKVFERLLPTEHEDIQEIVRGILHAQKRLADDQHRPLGRGTRTKGIVLRGTFTVLDLRGGDRGPGAARSSRQDLFANPGTYDATIRFANAASTFNADYEPDVRAVSFSVHLPSGERHDFALNNATTFPINDAHEFAVLMRVLEAGTKWQQLHGADDAQLVGAPEPRQDEEARECPVQEFGASVSAVPLFQRRPVPPWTERGREVLSQLASRQSGAASRPRAQHAPRRARSARRDRQADERVRLRDSVPRLGRHARRPQTARRHLLGRELERRMAGGAGAVPHRRAARAGPRFGRVG